MENPTEQNEGNLDAETKSYRKVHKKITAIFDEYDETERIPKILEGLKLFLKSPRINEDELRKSLSQVRTENKSTFTEDAMGAMRPILDLVENYPDEYEQIQREDIFNEDRHIKLNDLVYYMKTSNGNMHMHIAPNEHTPIGQKLKLLREGLHELARVVEQDTNVKEVAAASWIIAEAPKLLERLGFELRGAIPDKAKEEHFVGETRPVHHAVISREVLLEKYL